MAEQYPGYWQASDGNWYPDALRPPPAPMPAPQPPRPKRDPAFVAAGLISAVALVGAIVGGVALSGEDDLVVSSSPTTVLITSTSIPPTPPPTVAPEAAPPPTEPPTAAAPTLPPTTQPPPTAPPTIASTMPPPTAPPPTFPPATVAPAPAPSGACDPNYANPPCVPIDSDVDCAGGSGNGPSYVRGPVTIIGTDIYGLDGNDNDGIGCESG